MKSKLIVSFVVLFFTGAGLLLCAQSDDDRDGLRRILRDAMASQPDNFGRIAQTDPSPRAEVPSQVIGQDQPIPGAEPVQPTQDQLPTSIPEPPRASPNAPATGASRPDRPVVVAPGTSVPLQEVEAALAAALAEGDQGGDPEAVAEDEEELIGVEVLRFNNMPLEQFLDFYANFRQRTLLRPANLPLTQQITLKARTALSRREVIEAMDTVLAMNGITMIPVGEKFVKAVVSADALKEGAAFSDNKHEDLPEASQYVTQIVQLQHIDPAEAVQVIEPFANNSAGIVSVESSRVLVLRDYAINVKRMLEVLEKVDVEVPMELISEVIPIKYALATDIAQVLGTLTSTGDVAAPVGGGGIGGASRGGVNRTSSSANRGGSSLSRGGNNSGYRQNTRGVGQLQRATPTTGRTGSSFQQRLQQIVSRASSTGETEILGEVKIIPDERTNSILVFASKRDLDMIKDIVDKLDVVLAQVLIEAIIMEVSLSDGVDVGVSAFQRPTTAGNFTGVGAIKNGQEFLGSSTNNVSIFPSGFSYLGDFNNQFDVAVHAIARDSNINVISRPRIQTSHAVPASFRIGDTVPYITGSSFGDFGNLGGSRSTYSQLFVGVDLQVTPLINVDGLVVMEIEQVIENLGPSQTIDGNEVPTTTSREAFATVAVRDRDTIILGGFIKSDNSESKSGVPILKDIPFLGALFRSSIKSNARTEMIVLMRPTVLPTPEAAALAAKEEKLGMPSVREAEEAFQEAAKIRRDRFNERVGRD